MVVGTLGAAVVVACTPFGDANGVSSAEGGGAVDAAAPDGSRVGCEPELTTCDDFERASPVGGNLSWNVDRTERALLSIDALQFRSPTRSLKVVVAPAADADVFARGSLSRAVDSTVRHIRLAFSVLADVDGPEVQLALFSFAATTFVFVAVQGGLVRVVEQRQTGVPATEVYNAHPIGTLVAGNWARFDLDMNVDAKTIVVHRDDGELDQHIALMLTFGNAQTIAIGATYTRERTAPSTFYFDDVGLSAQ